MEKMVLGIPCVQKRRLLDQTAQGLEVTVEKVGEVILNQVKVSAIKPYERNPRRNDKAVEQVIRSIESTGYRTPIIVDENMVILAGHTRLKAIKKMGWKEVPFVVQYTDLIDEKKNEYRIRDNKAGELAEWDFEILEQDFEPADLQDFGFDVFDRSIPGDNKDIDEEAMQDTKCECPKCGFKW